MSCQGEAPAELDQRGGEIRMVRCVATILDRCSQGINVNSDPSTDYADTLLPDSIFGRWPRRNRVWG